MLEITLRWFAAAASASGVSSQAIQVPAGTTIQQVLADASAGNAELARIIGLSTVLVNETRCVDLTQHLSEASVLDVLPPFAGG